MGRGWWVEGLWVEGVVGQGSRVVGEGSKGSRGLEGNLILMRRYQLVLLTMFSGIVLSYYPF